MSDKTYRINEIFYSIQGEGIRAGTANVFVRFSGCNQTCKKETHGFDCDTEFVSGAHMTAEQIVDVACELMYRPRWVIFTGGEPLLQLDRELEQAFRRRSFGIAVETNGSLSIPEDVAVDFITCSPKVAEHAIRLQTCDELRYVRGAGQGIPKPKLEAKYYLLSPAFNGDQLDPAAMATCIELVKQNPRWRLSVQQHKMWKVR